MPVQRRFFSFVFAFVVLTCASAQEITVRPGDTLWDLALRHGTTVESLQAANGIVGASLQPGMVLSLPGGANASPSEYTVKTGDTLYDIALAFDISTDDLIAYNNLDGTVIRPGQVLSLLPPDIALAPLAVTVRPGDTLWRIARENEITVASLAAANGMGANDTLRPGNVLTVPGRYAGSSQDQGGAVAPVITVAPGDNLSLLARRYKTTVSALMSANGLSSTNIRAGQRLRVVPGSELVRAMPMEPPALEAGALSWPAYGELTSRFGYRLLRIGGTNMHYGIDIDGNIGDPIRAAAGGVVTYSGWQGGYGNLVVVESGNTEYYYAHAQKLLVDVGEVVTVGQLIGTIGSTGRSTGSHLHFEIRVNGSPVDPLPKLQSQAQH